MHIDISAGKVPKTVEFYKGENFILLVLLPDRRVVSSELILKANIFCPQKSDESVANVKSYENVSLKV